MDGEGYYLRATRYVFLDKMEKQIFVEITAANLHRLVNIAFSLFSV